MECGRRLEHDGGVWYLEGMRRAGCFGSVVWCCGDGGSGLDSVVGVVEAPTFAGDASRRAFKDLASSTRLEESNTKSNYAQKCGVRT